MSIPVRLVQIFSVIFLLAGCERGVMRRPPGYLRLGPISELDRTAYWIESERLLLRKDADGFYVMSTECTYDLSPLKLVKDAEGERFVSDYTPSKYDVSGKVLSGPAKAPLPYYELVAAPLDYGGQINTFYVRIGTEKPSSWRLKVPEELLRKAEVQEPAAS